jgi:hypothetical protein
MKRVAIGLLFMSGLLAAKDMPWWRAEALNTQSPPLHVKAHKSKSDRAREERGEYVNKHGTSYVMSRDKSTINAYVPYGK